MPISKCCRAKVKYGQRSGDDGPETIIMCQGCGRACGEFDPPCDLCGSDDPCSCGDYNPWLEMPDEEEIKNYKQPVTKTKMLDYPNMEELATTPIHKEPDDEGRPF
ncbi:MAG: hypothetical protein P4L74_02510 [Candidatus Doudnabacteria bacterium]|nr:hypothetical protein [Candidatus Doudnabacteria bacterium]